jgi:hypothetical protein
MKGEEDDESGYVKSKLDSALRAKVDEIEELKKQEEDEKRKFEKMTKKEKEIYKTKNAGRLDKNGLKKRRKTLLQQEIDLHEAYQLLLAEHRRKVTTRAKKKMSAVCALMKIKSATAAFGTN